MPERIAFAAVKAFVEEHGRPEEVRFVTFSPGDYRVCARLLEVA